MGVMPFLAACHACVLMLYCIVTIVCYVCSFEWQIKFSLSHSLQSCRQNTCWPIFTDLHVMTSWTDAWMVVLWSFSAGLVYLHSILYLLSAQCLSKRFLEQFTVGAITTSSGRSFHCSLLLYWSVSGQRSFAVLHSTCSWWVTTYVSKPSAIGQPTRPTQPFIISGSINE